MGTATEGTIILTRERQLPTLTDLIMVMVEVSEEVAGVGVRLAVGREVGSTLRPEAQTIASLRISPARVCSSSASLSREVKRRSKATSVRFEGVGGVEEVLEGVGEGPLLERLRDAERKDRERERERKREIMSYAGTVKGRWVLEDVVSFLCVYVYVYVYVYVPLLPFMGHA